MQIDFQDETKQVDIKDIDMIERLLSFAGVQENVDEDAELSVTFVSNDEIQVINRDYRQIDKPTDVISFALEEKGEGELEVVGADLPTVLGDIIISIDRAKEQAVDYNHSLQRELGFLSLHGFLHLLGYDHMEEADEKKMFKRQEDILNAFGLERE
ncbi:rRNA maturation RNase YbeY [Aquibacillus sediminis]|uniref:rRNA maturation RNase YbeY n=1 Tax=Aquibacillus sediminis TaxID=2574734 RepID=UPI001109284F|nr:rRNA maturation RNase YbeY [Aquibacillus sediminis]